jgi:cytochrome P450 family 135
MEQATIPRQRPAEAAARRPPASRLPGLVQGFRYARDPIGFFVGLHRRYGDVFRVRFPYFGDVTYVADPAVVKEVFTGSPERFHAGEANASVLEPQLGPSSLLTLDEREHLRQRKLLLPPFHGERVRRYGEVIRAMTQRDMATWPVGEPFALRDHTERITLGVILHAVFGVRDEDRFAHAAKLTGDFVRTSHLITSFPMLRRNLGRFSPWERFKAARAELDEFIYAEIAARRTELERDASDGDRDDVLSLLLQATDEDGERMTDRELRDELVTVVGAGHETTATALAWAMERLLRTPRVLERLRESLANGEDEYLDATIKETLRIRPVIVDVARKLTEDCDVGGYRLDAGTFVLPAIAAMHFREDLYPQPREFRPERFLDGGADTYVWIPFGGGVRRCIGAAFAQYEMRVVLREFVERAALRAPDPEPEKLKIRNITLAPARGARVVQDRPPRHIAERP